MGIRLRKKNLAALLVASTFMLVITWLFLATSWHALRHDPAAALMHSFGSKVRPLRYIVLGDSWSDDGSRHIFRTNEGVMDDSKPAANDDQRYWVQKSPQGGPKKVAMSCRGLGGRCSDGILWSEYVCDSLVSCKHHDNFAYSGAKLTNDIMPGPIPDLKSQIDELLLWESKLEEGHELSVANLTAERSQNLPASGLTSGNVITVWFGINDMKKLLLTAATEEGDQKTIKQTVAILFQQLERLQNAYKNANIILMNSVDITSTPWFSYQFGINSKRGAAALAELRAARIAEKAALHEKNRASKNYKRDEAEALRDAAGDTHSDKDALREAEEADSELYESDEEDAEPTPTPTPTPKPKKTKKKGKKKAKKPAKGKDALVNAQKQGGEEKAEKQSAEKDMEVLQKAEKKGAKTFKDKNFEEEAIAEELEPVSESELSDEIGTESEAQKALKAVQRFDALERERVRNMVASWNHELTERARAFNKDHKREVLHVFDAQHFVMKNAKYYLVHDIESECIERINHSTEHCSKTKKGLMYWDPLHMRSIRHRELAVEVLSTFYERAKILDLSKLGLSLKNIDVSKLDVTKLKDLDLTRLREYSGFTSFKNYVTKNWQSVPSFSKLKGYVIPE
ncbi:hypothetical protein CJU90_2541 [Yarrowia sp. C11]|nr:hypothetical protein CKK34_3989 [Yarrowia sp. E02]KAG5369097.1 hypothetical protein CJU90_2541 [Yarrowia sp. C11]